jgi:serine/threonine protein kinase
VDEIMGAMVYAAQAEIVHHDLKPANIVLDGRSARVIDWGLARFYQRTSGTSTSLVGGSLFYCSPEQAKHSHGWDTPLTDLFSIGGILYFLISNEAPLERRLRDGANVALQYWRMIEDGVRPIALNDRHLHPKLPPEVAELADRWLAYDRTDRVPHRTDPANALTVAHQELRRVSLLTRRNANLRVGRPGSGV